MTTTLLARSGRNGKGERALPGSTIRGVQKAWRACDCRPAAFNHGLRKGLTLIGATAIVYLIVIYSAMFAQERAPWIVNPDPLVT
jgi:hypothetical protein